MKSLLRYPNFLEKISKIKDKDRFKLMSSDEAKYLVRKGMVSFEELLELSNNERKFTALVFSFSADLIKSGKVEFENISELYDD
ncbi:MAG: ATP:corrinoid adenosyltransferase, partial [Rickettsiales bacterium]